MSTEATQKPTPSLPPQGAPCWIEICAEDPYKLKDFYASLFPAWTFNHVTEEGEGEEKTVVVHYTFEQPSGLSGGIVKLPPNCVRGEQPMGAGFTVYYFVTSIDEIEKEIVKSGGKKVLDKTPQGKSGWYANFTDLEGNRFGVYEAVTG